MIVALVIGLFAAAVTAAIVAFAVQERALKDSSSANRRLLHENRQLTEALCAKHGEPVNLRPSPTADEILTKREYPPFFRSKQSVDVQIGDKQVTLG